jgi:hypothetical protein
MSTFELQTVGMVLVLIDVVDVRLVLVGSSLLHNIDPKHKEWV